MSDTSKRIVIALAVFVVWIAVTMYGGLWLAGGKAELGDTINRTIAWNILAAAFIIAGSIALFGWKDMRFNAPLPGTLKPLWFPALYLAGFFLASGVFGFPPLSTLLFVFINTLIVGFSEEGMFRGIFYRALRGRYQIWSAVVLSSVLFGSVHILNLFTTGHVFQSAIQALGATMSGFVFAAMLLRTGSIIVPMIYHALWDFGTFTLAGSVQGISPDAAPASAPSTLMYFVPMLFILPNFLFALWLLKNLAKHPEAMARA